MAERVGFEPTYSLLDRNSISSRARYDLFGTSPGAQKAIKDRGLCKREFHSIKDRIGNLGSEETAEKRDAETSE